MRFGSVCSGIEAASVAFAPLGWRAAWFSEIDPFPSAVLAHRFPDIPNYGDMTKLPEMILNGEIEAPEMLCGGCPCQAFSIAGQRKSLDDDRGNLTLTFIEIANGIDHVRSVRGERACIVFYENVPGLLSTRDNAFGCFLAGLVGANAPLESGAEGNKWPTAGYVAGPQRKVAWRTLDAQHHGVPQRRRRVFVIASARDDFDPSKVFFEPQSVSGDSESSIEARQSSSPNLEGSIGSTSQGLDVSLGSEKPVTPTVVAGYGKCYNDLKDGGCLAVHGEASVFSQSSFANYDESETTGTIRAAGGDLGGGSESLIIKKKRLESTTQE